MHQVHVSQYQIRSTIDAYRTCVHGQVIVRRVGPSPSRESQIVLLPGSVLRGYAGVGVLLRYPVPLRRPSDSVRHRCRDEYVEDIPATRKDIVRASSDEDALTLRCQGADDIALHGEHGIGRWDPAEEEIRSRPGPLFHPLSVFNRDAHTVCSLLYDRPVVALDPEPVRENPPDLATAAPVLPSDGHCEIPHALASADFSTLMCLRFIT